MSSLAVDLSEEQELAADAIREYLSKPTAKPYFVLYGLAGTGKTTVLAHIAQEYRSSILCTLTGKAASILQFKTGLDACTIHSAFYRLKNKTYDKQGRPNLEFERAIRDGELSDQIVLIDECSMIGYDIANDILSTGAKVVAVGDPGQLQPVKGKRFFDKPDFTLTTIHRQALESPIIRQAHAVRAGKSYKPDGENFRVVPKATDQEIMSAEVILCHTHKRRAFANSYVRRIQSYIQPTPQPGEPLLCLKNAKDYSLFNGGIYRLQQPFIEGDTTICINVNGEDKRVPNVKFLGIPSKVSDEDLVTSFDFGYALTVHKAQGSEWQNVLLIDDYCYGDERREWLYTGITRAADRILVVR